MQMMINLKSKMCLVLFVFVSGHCEYDKMFLTYRFPAIRSHDALHGAYGGHTSAPDRTLSNQIAEGSRRESAREWVEIQFSLLVHK